MNRFDFILVVIGKIFGFCVIAGIASVLVTMAFFSLLFLVSLIDTVSGFSSILILLLMVAGVRTVATLVSNQIKTPKSFYVFLFVKFLPVILFLLLSNLGCIWTRCLMVFHPG